MGHGLHHAHLVLPMISCKRSRSVGLILPTRLITGQAQVNFFGYGFGGLLILIKIANGVGCLVFQTA